MSKKAKAAKPKIDRDKLRVQLRRLRKDALLDLLDHAIDLLPKTRLPALVKGHIDPRRLAPDGKAKGRLLDAVLAFRKASLRGAYYEDFMVTSKNFTQHSHGTETWIAECERLFNRCLAEAPPGRHAEVREACQVLFDLLRHVPLSPRGEYELTDALAMLIDGGDVVRAYDLQHFWVNVTDPAAYLEAQRELFEEGRCPEAEAPEEDP